MRLPEEFLERMQEMLGKEEYDMFIKSYGVNRLFGLRVNTLKVDMDRFPEISPFELRRIPWTRDGFYYNSGEQPGKHPYYYAGLYYIQEPSAMFPAEVLDARPGERILDLCAAPGGKSVQIGSHMKGNGILVSNDVSASRTKALVKNIELFGIKNAVVTVENPKNLAMRFEGFFDGILVDAPCSGEGMFRKDERMARSWNNESNEKYSRMQMEILEWAQKMVRPGGRIVYSTCTFSPLENEVVIDRFLSRHPDFELVEIPKKYGIQPARPEWASGKEEIRYAARLWPHHIDGEGHFTALLRHKGSSFKGAEHTRVIENFSQPPDCFMEFARNNLNIDIQGNYLLRGESLYLLPGELPDLHGIRVAKSGWYLGECKKDRFVPSHSMIMALKPGDIKRTLDYEANSREISSYLKGETLMISGEKGIYGICVDGFILGWATQMGTMLRNMYPKGWRVLN